MAAPLDKVTDFPALVDYLRDELEWPIVEDDFDALTFEYQPEELGLKKEAVGGGIEIRQLRPLNRAQPWGIFFLNLPNEKLPVTLVRNILGKLAIKKRASANQSERAAFAKHDLLFIAATGSAPDRRLAFAHFADDDGKGDAATLKVLGWDADDTPRRLGLTEESLKTKLHWPDDTGDADHWRKQWSEAFAHSDTRTVVRDSKAMAKALAALARRIRERAKELISAQTANGSLVKLHKAFKEALIHDLTPEGFADTYAQTIAYGLLSTAISRASGALTQDDMTANVAGTSPFLREMLGTFIEAGGRKTGKAQGLDFDELGITEVVELLRNADMEAVLADFDRRNPDEDPVIHFYELFLKEYDAAQKVKRGVFYTPRPVVGFIVRSVDEVLRKEFGLEDGLASTATWGEVIAASKGKECGEITLPDGANESDPFVRILDPATGTGTFLVECVDLINKTMLAKWAAAKKSKVEIAKLWNDYVPNHLLPRLTGFELMMAPYAIAHVKLGLKLADTGYTFGSDARAQIYLTNALEPAQDMAAPQFDVMDDALAHESKAANASKKTCFTAIVGNPPYAGHSANNAIPWIVDKVHDYKREWPDLLKPGQGKWLQDDYVKFLRLSQWELVRSGIGVLGFITNSGWLENPTFKGMRAKLSESFAGFRVLDLHGDFKRGIAPNGEPDGNVFEGVAQGVAITIGVRDSAAATCSVSRADMFGSEPQKLAWLGQNKIENADLVECMILPPENYFAVLDAEGRSEFRVFPSISVVMGLTGDPAPGIVTTHDDFAISFTELEQSAKVERLISSKDEAEARRMFKLCKQEQWNYAKARVALKAGQWNKKLGPIAYRPFDRRVTVFDTDVTVHLRLRATAHMFETGNVALISTRQRSQASGPWPNAFVADLPIESTTISNKTKEINYLFPLWIRPQGTETRTLPNIAPAFAARVAALTGLAYDDCVEGPTQAALDGVLPKKAEQTAMFATRRERGEPGKSFGPRDLFDYIYAVLHSAAYRTRYADYLKSDFARIPLPGSRALFEALIPLGTELVALHLLDADALPILKDPKSVRFAGSGEARVAQKPEFNAKLGRVKIGDNRWFEGVPQVAWDFHVGGYQPAQKWLKDRAARGGKRASDGRILTGDDILHYRRMIVALTRTAELMLQIDAAIDEHGGWPGAFKGMSD